MRFSEVGDVGVVVAQVGAEAAEQFHDLQRGRFAHVADAAFVGHADQRDLGPVDRFAGVVEGAFDALDAVVGHLLVDLARQLDELRAHVELAGPPRQIERIHRQAVPAHPRPRLEAHEPVRLRRGRIDDLPDVDAHPVGQDRQLVHQRDVDRAEDVLQQLRHLRDLGGPDADDVIAHLLVQRDGTVTAGFGEAADDLRRRPQRVIGAARIDALGTERQIEVAARREARLLQHRQQPLPRRARIRRRLQDHQLPGLQDPRERAARIQQRPQIGLAVRRQRRRHADQDRVRMRQRRRPRRRLDPVQHRLQALVGDVLDVGLARADRLDLAAVDVHRHHPMALLGERHRKRQPDVSETDDADAHARQDTVIR